MLTTKIAARLAASLLLALSAGAGYPLAAQESRPIYFGTPTRSVARFPLYVATKRGILQKEGINLQPVVMDSRVIVPSMASKEIPYSTGPRCFGYLVAME